MMPAPKAFFTRKILFALLGAVFLTSPAAAQDRGVVFAGGVFGADHGAYAGMGLALPGSQLGRGWAVRGAISRSDYEYAKAATTVKGREFRSDVSLLYQVSGPKGYLNLGPGARYTHTRLSPQDPGNRRAGNAWEVAVTADGAGDAGPWRGGFFGSYGLHDEDYFLRLDLTRAVRPGVRLGAEAAFDGDKTYRRRRAGLLLAITPRPGFELRAAVGGLKSDTHRGTYGSIGFSHTF